MKKLILAIFALIFSLGMNAQTTLTEAPDFTAVDYFGDTIHLYEILDGGQFVLMQINTRTNAATSTITPPMVEAYNELGANQQEVFFIGVVPNGTKNVTKKYVEEYGIEYPMIHNTDESNGMEGPAMDIWRAHNCDQPTTMLIAPNRSIILQDLGKIETVDDVLNAVKNAIEEYKAENPGEEPGDDEPETPATLAAPTNLRAEVEQDVVGYNYKYRITMMWDAVEGANAYDVYVNTETATDYYLGFTTGLYYIVGANKESTLEFYVVAANDSLVSEPSEPYTITIVDDAIEELTTSFGIYPNPASSEVKITTDMNGEADVNIYDMTGRKVKSLRVDDINNATINISDMEKGVYLININGKVETLVVS